MEALTKEIFHRSLLEADSICILGHVSPDGDCVGTTLALYNYILRLRKDREPAVQVYLEDVSDKFSFLAGWDKISDDSGDGKRYALAVVCDCADIRRMGKFVKYYENAGARLLIDHHVTNEGFADHGLIRGTASSASEVLFGLMEEAYLDREIAECIYTGIIHDTGVFRYSSTSPCTLEIAGKCIAQGIDFGRIIEESFFSMSYHQKQVLGLILGRIRKRLDGRIVYSYLSNEDRKQAGAENMDMDGMIDQLRTTTGALMAAFMYGTKDGRIKVSLRSNSELVDVSRICLKNGGGGHKKAAGCFMSPDFEKNMDEIERDVLEQLGESGERG